MLLPLFPTSRLPCRNDPSPAQLEPAGKAILCFGALREGMRGEVRRVLSGLLWRLEGFAGGQGQGEARQLATRAAAPGLWREGLPPAESVRKDPTRLPVGLDLGRACPFPRPSARAEAAAPAARSLPFCSSPGGGPISEVEYHRVADDALDSLQDQFEGLLEDEDVEGSDVACDSGVLELDLGDLGTYVINKQAPNKQIWLSSPLTGPFRYDYSGQDESWVYSRDGHTLQDKLSDELSELLGREITIL